MQLLTFSLVSVVLAAFHTLKWLLGCLWRVFAGLDGSCSIVRSTTLGVAKACLGSS